MAEPSERVVRKVEALFGSDAPQVIDRLRAATVGGQAPERVHSAILILSRGDLVRLDDALRLVEIDWRDVLVGAGLGQGDWPTRVEAFLND